MWRPATGITGADGEVFAVMPWDPDRAGPATEVVVLGGSFSLAGKVIADGVAIWDPLTGEYSALGSGVGGGFASGVRTLCVLANGDLVAGGEFPGGIARWNGTSWSSLGYQFGTVLSTIVLPSGDLIAAGYGVHRWDGSTWTAVGGTFNSLVWTVAAMPNGDLIAGGEFTDIGGTAISRLAKWNGATWASLGGGTDRPVYSLCVRANGELIAGGVFRTAGGVAANYIASWNGAAWSQVGAGLSNTVVTILEQPNGDLVVGGFLGSVRRFDGTAWSAMGAAFSGFIDGRVNQLCRLSSGDLVAGGRFDRTLNATQDAALRVALWRGSAWQVMGSGFTRPASAAALTPAGYVVASRYVSGGAVVASSLAEWNGTNWRQLGPLPGTTANCLATLPGGDVLVGGAMVVRWDGATWSPQSPTVNGLISSLLPLPNGELIIGGRFNTLGSMPANFIARWDGTTWSPLGTGMNSGINAEVRALVRAPNGDIIAAGSFATAGGVSASNIARWNGSAWSPLGAGTNFPILALMLLPNGDLIAGGDFTTAGGSPINAIARWDGTAWSQLGSGLQTSSVRSLALLPNGDLLVGGQFGSSGLNARGLARWDGSTWTGLDVGVDGAIVSALLPLPDGDVVAAGNFIAPGQSYVARLGTTCPATATPHGNGCASSVGAMAVRADTLPWLGATFRTTCSGFAQSSVGITVLGVTSPALPLSVLHPAAGPGCTLLASLDIILPVAPSNGQVVTQLAIPAQPDLIGAVLRQQTLQVELDQALNILLLSGSNGLTLTIGTF